MKLANSSAFSPKRLFAAIAPARARAARVPHPAWALAILAAFAIVGAFIADDYGVPADALTQRNIASDNYRYITGSADALPSDHNRYYGVAFELPLFLAERALRLTDSRSAFRIRYILTHLFFLCGAFACYALVYRLFNSVPIALLAMLLFLLHPRLYAHSFFNSKDLPALSMFMITLYAIHWAFSKNSVWAFAVLGACVGLATNIRTISVMLAPAVLGMRMCDFFYAAEPNSRHRILTTAATFAAAILAAFYISTPYLWADPLSFIDSFRTFSNLPVIQTELYRGDFLISIDLPWHFIPTWIWITTPPATLLFGLLGVAAALRRAAANPGDAFRGGDVRFGLLLVACFALPIAAVAALGINVYDGWRHLFFVYAPFCVLAAFALRWLPSEFKPASFGEASVRWGTRALACAGLAATLIAMIQLHPHQQVYFNAFVDRNSPERLRTQYPMEHWRVANIHGLRHLIESHPSGPIFVDPKWAQSIHILPAEQRRRVIIDDDSDPSGNYYLANWSRISEPSYWAMGETFTLKIYNNTVAAVFGDASAHEAKTADYAARQQELYSMIASAEPIARAHYDIYLAPDENAIVYFKSPCSVGDMIGRFFLHITPANPDDLPEARKRHDFDNLDFDLLNTPLDLGISADAAGAGAALEEICLAAVDLPKYNIAQIKTGQFTDYSKLWEESIDLSAAE